MAIPLSQLFARFGTELSPDQRLEFVRQIINSDHPSSCEAWEFLWWVSPDEMDIGVLPFDITGEKKSLPSTADKSMMPSIDFYGPQTVIVS
jgi:hypothetical protein